MRPLARVYATNEMLAAALRAGDERAIDYVVRVLKHHKGDLTKTANEIGVGDRTLRKWRGASEPLRAAMAPHELGRAGAARLGHRKGGEARAAALSPAERKRIASEGAQAQAAVVTTAQRRANGRKGGRPRSRSAAASE